jgi:alkylation response protein AidB-like acyl-CoA dehydrogenase
MISSVTLPLVATKYPRVQTIYGGTTEIMKEIIGRSLGF